jgi:hypothetical protein
VRRADNLTTFMCRLSRNLGASTSWNPKGLFRPVMGLLYLYHQISQSSQQHSFIFRFLSWPKDLFSWQVVHDFPLSLQTDSQIKQQLFLSTSFPQVLVMNFCTDVSKVCTLLVIIQTLNVTASCISGVCK